MREVLKLEYDASTASFVAMSTAWKEAEPQPVLDVSGKPTGDVVLAKGPDGKPARVRLLGVVDPVARFAVADLPEPHRSAMKAFLDALPDLIEGKVDADMADPEELKRKASEIASRAHLLEVERLKTEAELAQKKADADAHVAEAVQLAQAQAEKRARAAADAASLLEANTTALAQVEAQKAELARLELERAQQAADIASAREEARAVAAAIEAKRAELAAVEAATKEQP